MAKTGMIFKGAKGKLGEVVFQKGPNGSTVMRPRVTPKNPQTQAQRVQRAISATIGKAYSIGKAIFDHSFEGKSKGRESMDYFRKLNSNALRSAVNTDLSGNVTPAEALGACVGKNATAPIPWSYIISTGSLYQSLFSVVLGSNRIGVQLAAPVENETVAQYAARLGLVAGDIYTVCAMGIYNSDFVGVYDVAPDQCSFGFVRFIVRENLSTVETLMSAASYTTLFIIDQSGVVDSQVQDMRPTDKIQINDIIGHTVNGCIGIIRSREDSRQRSNSRMYFISEENEPTLTPNIGIKSPYVADAWATGNNLPGSQLILEGGNF